MSQSLPTGNFKWLNRTDIDRLDISRYYNESDKGLILEVDLVYPDDLHDLHNDFPLAPERLKVNRDDLSPYCSELVDKFGVTTGNVKKLIPTLNGREKYVIHYRNLKLYTSLGLRVVKVHRALEFDQTPWLKEYIDFNTAKRTQAKNAFEKYFFKLMNNSVFGKTMENIRKRVDIRLVTNLGQLQKLTIKPTFVSIKIFTEHLVGVHKIKESLELNKPAYVGMCILDLGKTLMFDFHYNVIKKEYGSDARLLFTDTDSLTYHIKTVDIYENMMGKKELYENSDYPNESPFYFTNNKKVIGKFKDEASGVPITQFVGLRSKMYSYIKESGCSAKTAKGIKKGVIKNEISHSDYRDTLFNIKEMYHKMNTIRSVNHQIGSQ